MLSNRTRGPEIGMRGREMRDLGRYKVTGDMEHDVAKYKTRTAEYRYEPAGVTAPPWGICSFSKKINDKCPGDY